MPSGSRVEYTRLGQGQNQDGGAEVDTEREQSQNMRAEYSELEIGEPREFGEADDARYYEEFSTYDPRASKSQQVWKRKRFSLVHICMVAVGCLGLYAVATMLWNTVSDGSSSKSDDGQKHEQQVPSLPASTPYIPPGGRSRKKLLTYDNVGSVASLVETKSLDWISHPTDSSIDGLYRELRNGIFTVLKADNTTWEHQLASLEEVAKSSADLYSPFIPLSWSVSADWEYLLFNVHSERVWRHSVRGTYFLYNTRERTMIPLTSSGNDRIQRVEWAPVGHRLLFVRDNNLFVTDMMHEIQVTDDGSDSVFNGLADWVYEEEVLGLGASSWWAPDGQALVYLRLDDSSVPTFQYQLYNPTNRSQVYPTDIRLHYPKPGAPNPRVSLYMYQPGFDVGPPTSKASDNSDTSFHAHEIKFDQSFAPEDTVIVNVAWISETHDRLFVRAMNRVQDHFKVYIADTDPSKLKATMVREQNTTEDGGDGAWIEIVQAPIYVPARTVDSLTADAYVDIVERNGYAHLALFSPVNAPEPLRWLTEGEFDVVSGSVFRGKNSASVGFTSTQVSSTEFHAYQVALERGGSVSALSPRPAGSSANKRLNTDRSGTYDVSFSKGGSMYTLSYRGPQLPWQAVYSNTDPKFERILNDNEAAEHALAAYDLPRVEFLQIPTADGKQQMNAMATYPPGFDANARARYGVLFRVYGGPNSQLVSRAFSLDWHSALVSQTDVPDMPWIVVTADGRGTGYRGRAWRSSVSQQLGVLEPDDQAAAARFFQQKPFVNPRRIAIWGWSYGGYTTSRAVERHPDVFRVGMAVAPVTDWRFYDSVYTERYMKTPQTNPIGYASSAVSNTTAFASARFLVQHGSGDDNVHLQNTLALVDMLEAADVPGFEMAVYTDSDHSIYTHGVRPALYNRMTNFLFRSFHELENKNFDFWRHRDPNSIGSDSDD
ncbi:Dpp4p [Coemansia sp. RSA 2703]|nr:Dpp4p [Coemansia sp. RSA 2703]KAJ2397753.1 Dpp4p [Coemansia sp. RSA 2603]